MTRVGRAIEKDETHGFMKIVIDADTRRILGAAILGTGGDEAIHGVVDIMNAGATAGGLDALLQNLYRLRGEADGAGTKPARDASPGA